jgi:hypothetical protein
MFAKCWQNVHYIKLKSYKFHPLQGETDKKQRTKFNFLKKTQNIISYKVNSANGLSEELSSFILRNDWIFSQINLL